MKLIDVNLLLYAYDESSPLHRSARSWLTRTFASAEKIGLTHQTILAFIRITTSSRIYFEPLGIGDACAIVAEWIAHPQIVLLEPTDRHWKTFADIAVASQSLGALVPDADLAVFAIEHGATLCTNDRDFSRFDRLRVEYPLMPAG